MKKLSFNEIRSIIESSEIIGKIYTSGSSGYLTVTLMDGTIKNLVFPLFLYEQVSRLIANKNNNEE